MSRRVRSRSQFRVVVLGAGPCGLGAALRLAEVLEPREWVLVEKELDVGGLAGSVRDQAGFVWDYGGHVLFTRNPLFEALLDSLLEECGSSLHERSVWARIGEEWVAYPVQLHWPTTSKPDRTLDTLSVARPRNFAEWLRHEFSADLIERFFRPYNEKVWQTPLEQLGVQWIDSRVARRADTGVGRQWGPNAVFRYPARGGAGEPWRILAKRLARQGCDLRLGSPVSSIDLSRRQVVLRSGEALHYESLISTLPLDQLLRLCSAPQEFSDLAARLVRTQTLVIGLGLEGPSPADPNFTWLYFPDHDLPFYRVSQVSRYSPSNTPRDGLWSLLVECSSRSGEPLAVSTTDVVAGLQRVGLLNKRPALVSVWRRLIAYGYPVPSLNRDAVLGELIPWLEDHACLSRGRFGAWKYEISNQDDAFIQGLAAVDRVMAVGLWRDASV